MRKLKATLTRTARPWVKPTRKLTPEEIQELIETYDYDPAYEDDETREPEPIYDEYGNPSRDTIAAMYETLHGLCEEVTLEELFSYDEDD